MTKVISKRCPRDGRHWDCQCARCGSSMSFEPCDYCGGEGWIEDDDWQADEGDGQNCETCQGEGGHWACCSSVEWCEANPGGGRAALKRGTIEWFTFDAATLTRCDKCGRREYAPAGQADRMTQPDGSKCGGHFQREA
jgi:hypothetical protein